MPKLLDPDRQAQAAVKKFSAAAASAIRSVTAEHTDGQDKHIVKAVKDHSRGLIDHVKGSVA